MAFRISDDETPQVRRLRDALAWDYMHEYVLTDTGMHIRHLTGSFLCGDEGGEGLREVTPWGGDDPCSQCIAEVPKSVRWVSPPNSSSKLSIAEVCERLGVNLVLSNERPQYNETQGSPSGAILEGWGKGEMTLYVGHTAEGKMNASHQYGALHELAHVVTAPYGFESEVGCGHYAVQYALAMRMENAAQLCKATKDMQGLSDPVFGGLMQARAWSLGMLNDDLSLNMKRLG